MNTAPPRVTKEDVIKHLKQLRDTFAHALTQKNISPQRFNEIREQMLPLDEQLRALGVDVAPTPQMAAAYVKQTRKEARRNVSKHKRRQKFSERTMRHVSGFNDPTPTFSGGDE